MENEKENEKESNYIFGIRAVIEAAKAGKNIEKVLLKKDTQGSIFQELMQVVTKMNIPFQYVPVERINKVTQKNHQGAVAYISPITYQNFEETIVALLEKKDNPIVMIMDSVTDIRNFGAIARTSECTGVDVMLIPDKGNAPVNSDAIKTSAGALLRIPVCREKSLMKAVTFLQQYEFQIFAASEKTNTLYTEADFTGPIAIVMGAEDKGVSKEVLKIVDQQIKIPLKGEIESLNVSVAAGVLLYEVLKQRS